MRSASSGLQKPSLEALSRQVELRDRLAVELDASLPDHAPRLARREPERGRDDGREMHRVAVGEPMLSDVPGVPPSRTTL